MRFHYAEAMTNPAYYIPLAQAENTGNKRGHSSDGSTGLKRGHSC